MALPTASTAIARVLRADCRLYSVSPTPTMQYLSLRDAMEILRAGTLRERGGGRQARAVGGRPGEGEEDEGEGVEGGAGPPRELIVSRAVVDQAGRERAR
jgi:hypothetical protein